MSGRAGEAGQSVELDQVRIHAQGGDLPPVVPLVEEFRDTLDDDIADSMKDPEYAAAWMSDLTASQRRVLSIMSRANLNDSTYAGWVDQLRERLDKNSLYALERRGMVIYDRHQGTARLRTPFVALATACREAAERAGGSS
jgi:hypothetical protein